MSLFLCLCTGHVVRGPQSDCSQRYVARPPPLRLTEVWTPPSRLPPPAFNWDFILTDVLECLFCCLWLFNFFFHFQEFYWVHIDFKWIIFRNIRFYAEQLLFFVFFSTHTHTHALKDSGIWWLSVFRKWTFVINNETETVFLGWGFPKVPYFPSPGQMRANSAAFWSAPT